MTATRSLNEAHFTPISSSVAVTNPFRRGENVTFPAGTPMRSTNPAKPGVFVTKRPVTVALHSVHGGHVDVWNDAKRGVGFVHLPTLVYVGSGDYWTTVKVTPELAEQLGKPHPTLADLHPYDRRHLDAEPGFGPGYDDRDL